MSISNPIRSRVIRARDRVAQRLRGRPRDEGAATAEFEIEYFFAQMNIYSR